MKSSNYSQRAIQVALGEVWGVCVVRLAPIRVSVGVGEAVGLLGRVPIQGSLILRKKFKAGSAENLITSQVGYQLYFCIGGGGGGGGAELLL